MNVLPETIGQLGEFSFIEQLKRKAHENIFVGIGDDTAVLEDSPKQHQLFAKDLLIEGRHFRFSKDKPQEIGWKAMARNVSDIASMGGVPTYALIGLAVPSRIHIHWLRELYQGFEKAARKYRFQIVGGDTSHHEKIVISVSMLGSVKKNQLITRDQAKVGDVILATGSFGNSRQKKHISFQPRLPEVQAILRTVKPSSMIDVSDGLAQDLSHILSTSGVGAVLKASAIPLSTDVKKKYKTLATRLRHAMTDGEDYEMVFTLNPSRAEKLLTQWKKNKLKTKLSLIGQIQERKGIYLRDHLGKEKEITYQGYQHF